MKEMRTKGVTMIELIVTIAIIGIFTGLSSIGVGYIQSGNVKSAAQTINSDLSKLKYDAKSSAATPAMYLYKVGDSYYIYCTARNVTPTDLNANNGTKLCNKNCVIKFDGAELGASDYKKIVYKKGSGGFSTASTVSGEITVEKAGGDGVKYRIVLVKETGKHYIEKY